MPLTNAPLADSTVRYTVAPLTSDDAQSLYELRRRCYVQSKEFEWLDFDTLRWGGSDQDALVLGVHTVEGELVATNRGRIGASRAACEACLEYSLADAPLRYPALFCDRTCTASDHAREGLTALTRRCFLEVAQASGLQAVMGVVYGGAPRVRSMLSIGYESYPCHAHWDSEACPSATPLVVQMPASRFTRAIQNIEREGTELLRHCVIDFPAIRAAASRMPVIA